MNLLSVKMSSKKWRPKILMETFWHKISPPTLQEKRFYLCLNFEVSCIYSQVSCMYSEERPGSLRAPSQFKYEIVRYSCNRIPIPLHLLNFNLHSSTLHLHTSFLNGWVKFTHFKVEGHSCMRACMQLELARIFSQHSSSHIKNKRLLLKNTLIMRPGLTYPLPVAHLNAQKASSHNTPSVSPS